MSRSTSANAGWIHFCLVAGFLLIVTIGWSLAMDKLGYWLRKEPVPWPAKVRVNAKTFQNTSLARRFGPYRMVKENEHADDLLSTLKIGSALDERRYDRRESNWYVLRIYEDTREPENSPYRYWYLDVVFYTGGEVTVPHVPDICVQAGGARPTGRDLLQVPVPQAPEPWRSQTPLVALGYERYYQGYSQELVQYYLFCVNGLPESSRDRVRLRLTNPTWRYVYYAKLQFFPQGSVGTRKQANRKAEEFLRYCLPAVLEQLPTPADIETLYEDNDS